MRPFESVRTQDEGLMATIVSVFSAFGGIRLATVVST